MDELMSMMLVKLPKLSSMVIVYDVTYLAILISLKQRKRKRKRTTKCLNQIVIPIPIQSPIDSNFECVAQHCYLSLSLYRRCYK